MSVRALVVLAALPREEMVTPCQPSPLASYLCFGDILTLEYCYKAGQEVLSCDLASLFSCKHKFKFLVGALLKDFGVLITISKFVLRCTA